MKNLSLIHLTCVRAGDHAGFGLSIFAKDSKQALAKARRLLEGSGYTAYPKKD